MLCTACRHIDLKQVVDGGGQQLHASYNALSDSASKGCTLCTFIRERLPLYKRDLELCRVQRIEISTGEWLGGTESSYEPLSSLFPSKKFGRKLATAPVVLRVEDSEIKNTIDTGIRFVQIAVPDFHRNGDMRYDLWQDIELYTLSGWCRYSISL